MASWISRDGFETTELPSNRLPCIIAPSVAEDSVRVQVVYHFGSNAEQSKRERGLAHFVEHMIFKGCFGNHEADQLEEEIKFIEFSEVDIPLIARTFGAEFNAFTTSTMTSFYFQVSPKFLKPFLQVLSCSMDRTRLDEQHCRSEKMAVIEEMYSGKDSLMRDALKSMRKEMFAPSDPNYHPTIGYEADLIASTAQDLRGFYDRMYHPGNASLWVTGNIEDTEDAKRWIEELFGPVTPKRAAKSFDNQAPLVSMGVTPAGSRRTKHMHFHTLAKSVTQLIISYKFPVERLRRNGLAGKAPALLSKILSGGEESRLYRKLVKEGLPNSGHCFSVDCFMEAEYHLAECYVILQGDTEMLDSADEWVSAVQRVVGQPVSTAEIAGAKMWVANSLANESMNLESHTSNWINDFHMTRDFGSFKELNSELHIVHTAEQLMSLAFRDQPWVWKYSSYDDHLKAEGAAREQSETHAANVRLLKANSRTTPLGVPHAVKLFAARYKRVDLSKNTRPLNATEAGRWTVLTGGAYDVVCAMHPQRHEELSMTTDGIVLEQFSQVLAEAFNKQSWESRGVFGWVDGGSVGLRAVNQNSPCMTAVVEFVRRFGSAISPQDEADLKGWWAANGSRLQGQWKAQSESMSKDGTLVVSDFVQDLVSDSHYVPMSTVKQMYKSFDLDKACAMHRKYWTDVIHVLQQPEIDLNKYHKPNLDLMTSHELDSRLPTPRPVSGQRRVRKFKIANVPLNQVTMMIGKPGLETKADYDYDGVRAIAQCVMFASLGSRFMKHMREGTGGVYYCGGYYGRGATHRHKGYDGLVVKCSPGEEDAMLERVEEFIQTPVDLTDAEVNAAKRTLIHGIKQSANEASVISLWSSRYRGDIGKFNQVIPTVVQKLNEATTADVESYINLHASTPYNVVGVAI
tara:strand:- start:2090 stop:4825 length:2736 start_codon:yes stop_codon:yes gene_type:complete